MNLARADKDVEPTGQVLNRDAIPVRLEGDAIVRTLVGEGSPIRLGTPTLVLDVELPEGGSVTMQFRPSSSDHASARDPASTS